MNIELWLVYAGLSLLFALTPGPAVILAASQALARGFRTGMAVAFGVQAGNATYFLISATGLGAIPAASEAAFPAITYAGGACLLILGVCSIANARLAADQEDPARTTAQWRRPFFQGLVNQLVNPKTILFLGAPRPRFLNAGAPLGSRLALLGATPVLIEIPILAPYVGAAASGRRLMAGGVAAIGRERVAGLALIAAGGALSPVRRTSSPVPIGGRL